MSTISEIEIKSMTKEQNYMRGYEDGRADVLNKIRTEIEKFPSGYTGLDKQEVLEIIDKYRGENE